MDIVSYGMGRNSAGKPSAADVEAAVNKYLEAHPVQPTPIDKTLTQEGQAADAKATGDAITAAVEYIQSLLPTAGGEIKPEEIEQAIADYFAANPIQTYDDTELRQELADKYLKPETGIPESDLSADVRQKLNSGGGGGGGSVDEWVVMENITLTENKLNTEQWGHESHLYNQGHYWTTDIDRLNTEFDCIRVYIKTLGGTGVASGELKVTIGLDSDEKPRSWSSWDKKIYFGFSSYMDSTYTQSRCTEFIYDLRTRKSFFSDFKASSTGHNYSNNTFKTITEDIELYNNALYLRGIKIYLVSGSLPAGTKIVIIGRKANRDITEAFPVI